MLICGPCSAESEEQVFATARLLKELLNPEYFRAGIWKPRTRPDTFAGVGEIGLPWLQRVQKELGMAVMTEVACADHVEMIAKYGIKAFWVGARTTSNPFSVQEIAEAVKGSDFRIFVKNPVNPDVDLWTGAIERFQNVGCKSVSAVCRGFYPITKTDLRNSPCWEVPIELAHRMPHIDIICDPSHIAGNTNFIQRIAQQAIDLNMAGLMVESHCSPQTALSDSKQQLTPSQLKQMLDGLKIKNISTDNQNFDIEIENLRNKIDILDFQLIDILKQRFNITSEIGKMKKENNVAVLQIDRWNAILESRIKYAAEKGLSEEFVKEILEDIHKASIEGQINLKED